jgi:peptidyl-prolyl cis-trans isomerase SurA
MSRIPLFFAAIFLFVFFGISHGAVLLDRVVAIVNQEVITWSELYGKMEADASPKVKELHAEAKRKVFKENEAFFLETLINVRLQLQEAKAKGIRVSDAEVQEAIDNIKKKYAMSDDAFRDSLKGEGFTYEEYRRRLWEQIMISKVVTMQVRNRIVIDDDDLRKFVTENKGVLENSEGYKISQIVLKKQKDVDAGKVEEKAGELLAQIKTGASFGDLAKQYSEDPSASSGGELGVLKKNQLGKDFIEVLANMGPGDVSRPFWTDRGLHIIKLESRTEAKTNEEFWEEAKKMLNNKIFTERYEAWIKSLREKSFIEVKL